MNTTDQQPAKTLKELCAQWADAKRDENAAKQRREAAAAQILALVEKKDKGATTTKVDGFGITATGKVPISMDWDAWELVKGEIPPEMHPVKNKPELDEKGVAWLKENKPELYAKLPITVKPASHTLEVKVTL